MSRQGPPAPWAELSPTPNLTPITNEWTELHAASACTWERTTNRSQVQWASRHGSMVEHRPRNQEVEV